MVYEIFVNKKYYFVNIPLGFLFFRGYRYYIFSNKPEGKFKHVTQTALSYDDIITLKKNLQEIVCTAPLYSHGLTMI